MSAAPAAAQVDATRVGAHLALGFGGDADSTFGNSSGSASLDPTVGFGLRGEQPLHDYVVVGGAFELLTFEWDAVGAEREAVLDFDVFVRGRYVIEITPGALWLEPYVAVPFGFTMGVLNDPDGDGDEIWPGWNVGVLGGAYLVTNLSLAFFFELGWRHHQIYTEVGTPFGDIDWKLVTNQLAMQLGAAFLLPGS